MYKKYYSYNDMPVPVKRETPRTEEHTEKKECTPQTPSGCAVHKETNRGAHGGLLANIETDDIILIAVILALLLDGCEDRLLLGAIAFVLLSGW